MRIALALVVALSGCDQGATAATDAALPDAGGSVLPAPCSHFVDLESRWWRKALPYIEPVNGRIFVDGTYFAITGQSDPQDDGTTLLWASRVFHFEDGTTQLGAAGTRTVGDTTCVWVLPVRVE